MGIKNDGTKALKGVVCAYYALKALCSITAVGIGVVYL